MKQPPYFLKCVLLAWLFVFFVSCDQSKQQKYTVADVPDPKKTGGGYVSNPDHLIADATVNELNAKLSLLDNAGKVQVGVVVLRSIGNNDTRDFVHQLFNYWKIGDKEKNNGLLILMVEDARKLEFETGKGIEADMPDIICFRIQQEYMIPRIKEHNYDAAFTDGILSVASLFNNGNYAYTQLPDMPAADGSLMPSVTGPVVDISPRTSPATDEAVADSAVAVSDAGDSDNVTYAEPQPYAGTYSSGEATASSGNSYSYTGDFSFIGIIFWIIVSALMMYVFFGKKRKKRAVDAEPVLVSEYQNEFLRPGWIGLVLLHLAAFFGIYYVTNKLHKDAGFVVTFVIYYITWVVFIHVAALIISMRSAIILKGKDRHEKWLQLAVLYRDFSRAKYPFPAPFLWIYVALLKRRMEHLRNDPYDCHHCLKPMHKLDEEADNQFLDKKQVIEEGLHSVDYDVWGCDTCGNRMILNYTNMRSQVAQCPSCAHMSYQKGAVLTKKSATYSSEGWGIIPYTCAACGFKHDYRFTIAKLVESSSSSSSSSSSFSSSSSSSSDWGGGSSGGGGASSSW